MSKCGFNKVALQHLFLRTPLDGYFYKYNIFEADVNPAPEKNFPSYLTYTNNSSRKFYWVSHSNCTEKRRSYE